MAAPRQKEMNDSATVLATTTLAALEGPFVDNRYLPLKRLDMDDSCLVIHTHP
jgi:hypothetical protein